MKLSKRANLFTFQECYDKAEQFVSDHMKNERYKAEENYSIKKSDKDWKENEADKAIKIKERYDVDFSVGSKTTEFGKAFGPFKDGSYAFEFNGELYSANSLSGIEEKFKDLSYGLSPPSCAACGAPYHPATGHRLSANKALCGPCAKDFYQWYKTRMTSQNRKKDGESWNESASKSIIGDMENDAIDDPLLKLKLTAMLSKILSGIPVNDPQHLFERLVGRSNPKDFEDNMKSLVSLVSRIKKKNPPSSGLWEWKTPNGKFVGRGVEIGTFLTKEMNLEKDYDREDRNWNLSKATHQPFKICASEPIWWEKLKEKYISGGNR
jgi:hypothetical protein